MDQGTSEQASPVIGHPGSEIDLQQFCSADSYRPTLLKPFSHGAFSYATNGVYAVRVPRRPDVPEVDNPKIAETLNIFFARLEGATFGPVDVALPDIQEQSEKAECEDCDGRGVDHECPSCQCTCNSCDGSGEVTKTDYISVDAFGEIYRLPHLRQILALPQVEIAYLPRNHGMPFPALFRFDGGIAALMVMRGPYSQHVKAHTR